MTSGWTERHTAVALLILVSSSSVLVGLLEPAPYGLAVAAGAVVVAVASLAVEPLAGLVVGMVLAAGLIGLKQLGGEWSPTVFWPSLFETVAFMAAGFVGGFAGRRLRAPKGEPRPRPGPVVEPALGSLGLLDADMARARLEEEIERARDHDRRLAVVVMALEVTDAALSVAAREAAIRAVARALEARLRPTDVPFALDERRIGAILPEADMLAAWDRVGPIVDATGTATFRDREQGTLRPVAQVLGLQVGVSSLGPNVEDAEGLLAAASPLVSTGGPGS